MKINNDSICSIISSKGFRDFQIEHSQKLYDNPNVTEGQKRICENKFDFYGQNGFRVLVLSNKCKDLLKHYKVLKEIRFDVLRSLPNRKDVIQIDVHNCIKYMKTDKRLDFISCYRKNETQFDTYDNDDLIHTHFMTIDLVTEQIGFDDSNTYSGKEFNSIEEIIENYYSFFMVVITYLELTPITLKIIEGTTSKKRTTDINISNSSRRDIIYVTTNWNVETIRIGDINVCGHWRLQPYGSGFSRYKYIFIQPYVKGLTKKLPQKELC